MCGKPEFINLWKDEKGLTSTEYALMLALIVLSSLVAFGGLSTEVQSIVRRSGEALSNSTGIGCSSS